MRKRKFDGQQLFLLAELCPQEKEKRTLNRQWFVRYWFINPLTGRLQRFKEYKGFAKLRTVRERELYGKKLVVKINRKLLDGWNPFIEKGIIAGGAKISRLRRGELPAMQYLQQAHKIIVQGLENDTVRAYRRYHARLIEYLQKFRLENSSLLVMDYGTAENMLNWLTEGGSATARGKLSGKSINEHRAYYSMLWEKIGKRHPELRLQNAWSLIDKRKHTRRQAPIFDEAVRRIIREKLPPYDQQLWLAVLLIYNTFLRPGKELRALRIRNFNFFSKTITVEAIDTKSDRTKLVVYSDEVASLLEKMNLHEYPADYFIFGPSGPSETKCGESFFNDRWSKFRKHARIPAAYKLYGMKHTGNVVAARAGIPLPDISRQNSHTTIGQTVEYLEQWKMERSEKMRDQPDF